MKKTFGWFLLLFSLVFAVFLIPFALNQFAGVSGPARWLGSVGMGSHYQHLGAEVYNTAVSLRSGHGFSSPFTYPTGPTAWVAPVLPVLYAAGLFLLGDNRFALAVLAVVGNAVVMAGIATMLLSLLSRVFDKRVALKSLGVGLVAVCIPDFRLLFRVTEDSHLSMLFVTLLVWSLVKTREPPQTRKALAWWSCAGILCLLSNPLVFVAGVVACTFRWWRGGKRRLLLLIACISVGVSPWLYRNYKALGFLGIKSNGFYELYQSQFLTEDGLVDFASFRQHPYKSSKEAREFKKLGEPAYLALKKKQVLSGIRDEPLEYARRVGNRFLAATLVYYDEQTRREKRTWKKAGRAPPRRLATTQAIKSVLHVIPLLSLLLLLFVRPTYAKGALTLLCVVYCAYLTPYVLISYYQRYAVPLLPVKVLAIAYVLGWRLSRSL